MRTVFWFLIGSLATILVMGVALNYPQREVKKFTEYALLIPGAEEPIKVLADVMRPSGDCTEFLTEGKVILRVCFPHAVRLMPTWTPPEVPTPTPDPNAARPGAGVEHHFTEG